MSSNSTVGAATSSHRFVREEELRQEELRHLEKEAFQLANYYFVFQGVIFTAIYGEPSELKCRYRWLPIALSALAGSINFVAILRIAWKYKTTLDAADRYSGVNIPVCCARCWRWVYFFVCAFIFVAFLVVTVVACWFISCGKEKSATWA